MDDVVDVISDIEPGWWQGSLNGKIGVFPDNFCELLPEEKPSGPISTANDKTENSLAALPVKPGTLLSFIYSLLLFYFHCTTKQCLTSSLTDSHLITPDQSTSEIPKS